MIVASLLNMVCCLIWGMIFADGAGRVENTNLESPLDSFL